MKDLHDASYWTEVIKMLGGSLKTYQPQNRGDYTRAIIFAERKLRRLKTAAMVAVFCLVIGMGGCRTIEGFADDMKSVASGTREYMINN